MDQKCVDLKSQIAEENKLISDLQETHDDKQAQEDATDAYLEDLKENKLISDLQETHDDKQAQKDATDAYLEDLKENCDWIMAEFENRKKQRKDEIAGLDDAKSALAGMKS